MSDCADLTVTGERWGVSRLSVECDRLIGHESVCVFKLLAKMTHYTDVEMLCECFIFRRLYMTKTGQQTFYMHV